MSIVWLILSSRLLLVFVHAQFSLPCAFLLLLFTLVSAFTGRST